ncbi:hypothetical protein [Gracilimonas tropica]|uniref:hypothetical protein n=1 Tax=Gracilimonas tropica TaxID=454600 RepID=UPI00037D5CDC|nr:hypothetical protein [Gracilimonas tropica]
MSKPTLQPCPECGGQATISQHDKRLGGVYLTACENFDPDKDDGCSMIGAGWTEEESIQDWNAFGETPEPEWKREYREDPFRSRYNAMD